LSVGEQERNEEGVGGGGAEKRERQNFQSRYKTRVSGHSQREGRGGAVVEEKGKTKKTRSSTRGSERFSAGTDANGRRVVKGKDREAGWSVNTRGTRRENT